MSVSPTDPDLLMFYHEGKLGKYRSDLASSIGSQKIEPNPHVSPDNRWVVFTATLDETPQVYAVDLGAPSADQKPAK